MDIIFQKYANSGLLLYSEFERLISENLGENYEKLIQLKGKNYLAEIFKKNDIENKGYLSQNDFSNFCKKDASYDPILLRILEKQLSETELNKFYVFFFIDSVLLKKIEKSKL